MKETVQEKGERLLLFALMRAFSVGCLAEEVKEAASAVASDASAAAAGI